MSCFRRKRTARNGKGTMDRVWTIEFSDHADIVRLVPGFSDRSASVEMERHIKRLVSLRQAGGSLDAELNRFVESAPSGLMDKLAAWGILPNERAARGKSVVEHIQEWSVELTGRGNTPRHVKNFVAKVTALFCDSGWKAISDINLPAAQQWLAEKRQQNMAAATANAYIRAAKGFCRWLRKVGRLSENPLKYWQLLNERSDRRKERHAFTVEELGKLLAAAEAGPVIHGMTGPARSLLYRTAVETGFRWSELHSLTRASFDFAAMPPTVTIAAAYAKNGDDAILPLRPELAADLKASLSLSLPAAKAFPGMWKDKGAGMIRADLEATGILTRDENDNLIVIDEYGLVYDFHCLRATFATLLNKARVPLVTAQRLMRHSDPKLTANIYTHVLVDDGLEELSKLPPITASAAKSETAIRT